MAWNRWSHHKECARCKLRLGKRQRTDGDAAMLFVAAAHVPQHDDDEHPLYLCAACIRTLEAMALRAAGLRSRAGSRIAAGGDVGLDTPRARSTGIEPRGGGRRRRRSMPKPTPKASAAARTVPLFRRRRGRA